MANEYTTLELVQAYLTQGHKEVFHSKYETVVGFEFRILRHLLSEEQRKGNCKVFYYHNLRWVAATEENSWLGDQDITKYWYGSEGTGMSWVYGLKSSDFSIHFEDDTHVTRFDFQLSPDHPVVQQTVARYMSKELDRRARWQHEQDKIAAYEADIQRRIRVMVKRRIACSN
jgi:hypothetical protein